MDVVILIDCWENYGTVNKYRQKMFNNIVDSIEIIDPKLIVLASYQSNELFDNNLQKNNKWFSTFFEYFPDFKNRLCGRPNYETSNTILWHNFNNLQIALTHQWQLDFVLNQNNIELNRAWFFGMHWHACLRNRELGWHNLKWYYKTKYRKDIDILFKDNCSLKADENGEFFPEIEYDNYIDAEYLGDHSWKLLNEKGPLYGKAE